MKCKKCGFENTTRTNKQNASLHKYFGLIAEQLNELGMEFNYMGFKGSEMSLRYTPTLIKETLWKPIQNALFGYESTTKLNTHEMNQIIDVISKFFSEQEIEIEFPSMEAFKNKLKKD